MIYLVVAVFVGVLSLYVWDVYCFWRLDDEMDQRVREICEEWLEEQARQQEQPGS